MSRDQMDRRQDEGALRIMEALSAVDEALVERSGMSGTAQSAEKSRRNRKPVWRWGRAWAACLCLLAVGALSWYGLRPIWAPKGGANQYSGSTSAVPEDAKDELAENEMSARDEDAAAPDAGGGIQTGGNSGVETAGSGGAEDGSAEENAEITADRSEEGSSESGASREVTEEDGRAFMPFGAYIPENLPEGYRAASAWINEERQSVTVTWERGMDTILITVSAVEPGTVRTVDVSKPETYDMRLYEVPYAETVPAEYWEIFDNPVFDSRDMRYDTGLDLVSSRMIAYGDAGDTDTPRGRFSVLVSEDILLYFNGRGTPEEIWNMLYSMKR